MIRAICILSLCIFSCVQKRAEASKGISQEPVHQNIGLNLTGTLKEECQKFLAKSPKASNASEQAYIDYAKTCTQMDEKELEKIMQDPTFQSSYSDLKTKIQQNSNSTQTEKKDNGLEIAFFVEGGVFALLAFGLGAVSYKDWRKASSSLKSPEATKDSQMFLPDAERDAKFEEENRRIRQKMEVVDKKLQRKFEFLGKDTSYNELTNLEKIFKIDEKTFQELASSFDLSIICDDFENEELKKFFNNKYASFEIFDSARKEFIEKYPDYRTSNEALFQEASKFDAEAQILRNDMERLFVGEPVSPVHTNPIKHNGTIENRDMHRAKSNGKISVAIAFLSAGLFAAGGALSLQGESENTSPLAIFLTNLGRLYENK